MALHLQRFHRANLKTYFFKIPKKALSFPWSSGVLSTAAVGTDFVVSADLADADDGAGEGRAVWAPEEDIVVDAIEKLVEGEVRTARHAPRA